MTLRHNSCESDVGNSVMIGARASSVVVDMLVLVITWVQLWYMTRREMASSQVSPKSFARVFLRDGG